MENDRVQYIPGKTHCQRTRTSSRYPFLAIKTIWFLVVLSVHIQCLLHIMKWWEAMKVIGAFREITTNFLSRKKQQQQNIAVRASVPSIDLIYLFYLNEYRCATVTNINWFTIFLVYKWWECEGVISCLSLVCSLIKHFHLVHYPAFVKHVIA